MIDVSDWFVEWQSDHSLVGCVVVPGFEFREWKLASYNELVQLYPNQFRIDNLQQQNRKRQNKLPTNEGFVREVHEVHSRFHYRLILAPLHEHTTINFQFQPFVIRTAEG